MEGRPPAHGEDAAFREVAAAAPLSVRIHRRAHGIMGLHRPGTRAIAYVTFGADGTATTLSFTGFGLLETRKYEGLDAWALAALLASLFGGNAAQTALDFRPQEAAPGRLCEIANPHMIGTAGPSNFAK